MGTSRTPPAAFRRIWSLRFFPRGTASQIQSKRKNYQESGVIQVWIDAERRLVELIYPDRPVHFFQENQPLVIDKLADLSVDLKTLFSI